MMGFMRPIPVPPQDICERLDSTPVVCLDDIDSVAGDREWELQLFNFLNRKTLYGGTVVVASARPPSCPGWCCQTWCPACNRA
jgi:DnaA family protein